MANWIKSKSKLNLLIDAVMFVALALMAGLGFLIKWVLVPGFVRNEKYGSDVELGFLGLDRHEWGSVHLWVSISFLVLILLHIVLHWQMIDCIFRKMVSGKAARLVIAVVIGLLVLFFAVGPLLISPDVVPNTVSHEHHKKGIQKKVPASTPPNPGDAISQEQERDTKKVFPEQKGNPEHEDHAHDLDIAGYMTLAEVAAKYEIPVSMLAGEFNISPASYDENVGRLKRQYGFSMDELKEAVVDLKSKKIK
ncbi:MAG: DUF4405 domain-containing protein [Prolixibacteraceae bacterium]|nr:DUF4405 domain-containing protein [Prolixibacteraceae bacterium]